MVIRELGYPSRTMLYYRTNEYNNSGDFDTHKSLKTKYSEEQRKTAVNNYLYNGRSVTKTVRELWYPGKTLMKRWIQEDLPELFKKRHCIIGVNNVKYSPEQK